MQHCRKVLGGKSMFCTRNSRFFVFSLRDWCSYSRSISAIKNVSIDEIVKTVKDERKISIKTLPGVLSKIDFANLTSPEAIALLNCCSKAIPNASNKTRNQTCKLIYQYLQQNQKINLDAFHTYIKICTENLEPIDHKQCLELINFEPTRETYKLLLENVCEQGEIEQAYNILETMKDKKMPVDDDVFNSLVLCHALQGGLNAAETIFQTMKTTRITETNVTTLNLFKGLLRTKNYDDFKKSLQKYPIILNDQEFLFMLECIGLTGNLDLYEEVEFLFNNIVPTHELQIKIKDVCIYLIHTGQIKTALQIYEKFVTFETEVAYGEALLKEMLHCGTNINDVIVIAQQIGKNELALENLTGFALQQAYIDAALELFKHIPVRCHYFWPIFIHEGKTQGEIGAFAVIQRMKIFSLKPDAETIEYYILPYCNLNNLPMLVAKFKEHNITKKEVVSPLVSFLLKRSKVKDALELCNSYNVDISTPNASKILAKSWKATYDNNTIVKLFKTITEDNLVQNFLIKTLKLCRSNKDYRVFLQLAETIKSENLRISLYSGSEVTKLLEKCPQEMKDRIKNVLNSMLDVSHNMYVEEPPIPHPRKMTTQDLECHLIELEEKRMQTRGVLRRLIQAHAREGDLKRVKELRDKLINLGYEESPGMKSSIMHNYILAGQINEAINLYDELKREHLNFALDSYKCIDLATLLVKNLRFEEAITILEEESKTFTNINTEGIVRNCRELLLSCTKEDEQIRMYEVLLKSGLCKPTNVMLGPLIRLHLNRNDLATAVEKFIEISKKYKCTPLQRELLGAVSKAENFDLLEKVIKSTQEVHGAGQAHVGVIAALAETDQVKPLRKFLIQTNIGIKPLLERQCKRWTEERKIEPLIAISKAADRLSNDVVNLSFVYNCILDIYENQNDFNAVIKFYDGLPEDHIERPKLEPRVLNLLRKNNLGLPNRFNFNTS